MNLKNGLSSTEIPPNPPSKRGERKNTGDCEQSLMKHASQYTHIRSPLFEGGWGGFALQYKNITRKYRLLAIKNRQPLHSFELNLHFQKIMDKLLMNLK